MSHFSPTSDANFDVAVDAHDEGDVCTKRRIIGDADWPYTSGHPNRMKSVGSAPFLSRDQLYL